MRTVFPLCHGRPVSFPSSVVSHAFWVAVSFPHADWLDEALRRPVVDEHSIVAAAHKVVVEVFNLDPEDLDPPRHPARSFYRGNDIPRRSDRLALVQLVSVHPAPSAGRPNHVAGRDSDHLPTPAELDDLVSRV